MKVALDTPTPLGIVEGTEAKLLSFDLEKGRRRTHLYGMQHLAIPEFYDTRKKKIEQNTEARVLLEEIDYKREGIEIPEHARDVIEFVEAQLKTRASLFKGEFVEQRVAFNLENMSTLRADFTLEEFFHEADGILRLYRETILLIAKKSETSKKTDEVSSRLDYKKQTLWQMNLDLCPPNIQMLMDFVHLRKSMMTRLEERNQRVIDHIVTTADNGEDSHVPWGIHHLPGINKLLQAKGWTYVPGSKAYTTFMHL